MALPTQDLNNDLIGWTCSCSLAGAYGGDASFVNHVQQYSTTDLYREFQISFVTTVQSELADDTCFAGTVTWLKGVIHAVEDLRGISEDLIKFKIRSFFAFLAKKPVNSEFFDDTAENVLATLITDYGGVPAALTDFTGITLPITIKAPISGNNFLDELRKVAEASESVLFVDKEGKLIAEDWKDDTDSVDIVIPDEAVKFAKRNRNTQIGPTVMDVRGRFVSQFDCGSQVLSSADPNNPNSPNTGKAFNKKGATTVCSNEGIEKDRTRMKLNNLAGGKVTKKGIAIDVNGDGIADAITSANQFGELIVTATGGQGEGNYDILITGKHKPANEHKGAGSKDGALAGIVGQQGRRIGRMPRNLTGLPIADISELMPSASPDKDKTAEEPELLRMEIIQSDADLITEFGVVYEQVDNLYVSDFETLFDIAVRRFQEFKIKRKTWEVDLVYLPCINLNDIVTFTTPDTNETITGIVLAMKVDYDGANAFASMKLSIGSFEDIGSTSYTSANLFRYPEMCGSNGVDWIASVTGDAFVLHHGGYVQLGFDTSGGTATLTQNFKMEIGASYSLVYNLVKDSGADMVVKILDSGTHATKTSSITANDVTLNFTPDEVSNTIEFETAGQWYLSRPRLFKTVTK